MKNLIAIALLAAAPFAASAADKTTAGDYTFVEGGYQYLDTDFVDADGAYLKGSYKFDSNAYIFGQVQYGEFDNTNVDLTVYDVGVGYALPVGKKVDVLGELAYVRTDFAGFDADGYRAGVGVKAAFTPSFEGLAQVNYRDGGDFDGEWAGVLGARYAFNDRWSVNGQAEIFEDTDAVAYQVGVRYSF